MEDSKLCRRCGETKPRGAFSVDRSRLDGLQRRCKVCRGEQKAAHYRANTPRYRANAVAWQARNRKPPKIRPSKPVPPPKPAPEVLPVGYKRCTKCKVVKLSAEYCVRRASKDGLAPHCRACLKVGNRASYRANPGGAVTRALLRKRAQKQARPGWACMRDINRVYREAKRLGFHVDHIVPIRSRLVCGLHVHANLQVLHPDENFSKNNFFWPDMP